MVRSSPNTTGIDMKSLVMSALLFFAVPSMAYVFQCESPTPAKAPAFELTLTSENLVVMYKGGTQGQTDFRASRFTGPDDSAFKNLIRYRTPEKNGRLTEILTFTQMLEGGAPRGDGTSGGRVQLRGLGAGNIWHLEYMCERR